MGNKFSFRARNKYGAKKTLVDGFTFASKAEAQRYVYLKTLQRIGEIEDLELQPAFDLNVNGHKVCKYVADFRYRVVKTGEVVIEDVKSAPTKTPEYRIKNKLMRAIHGIEIQEVA